MLFLCVHFVKKKKTHKYGHGGSLVMLETSLTKAFLVIFMTL